MAPGVGPTELGRMLGQFSCESKAPGGSGDKAGVNRISCTRILSSFFQQGRPWDLEWPEIVQ